MNVSIQNLRVNPAQMRTRCQAEELAGLALQVQGGLDPALRLLVTPRDGHFVVVSGHRRWLALMLAALCPHTGGNAEALLAQMLQTVREHCDVDENGLVALSPALYEEMVDKISREIRVPAEVWEGSEAEEVMTLIRANTGAEEPDLVGQAHAFHVAVERGILIQDLAREVGMPEAKVEAIMTIPSLPGVFKDALNNGRLNLEAVPALAGLSVKQRRALGQAMKEHMATDDAKRDYTASVRLAALYLGNEPRVLERTQARPEEYNSSYVLRKIWEEAKAKSPAALYKAIASKSLQGHKINQFRLFEVLASLPKVERYFFDEDYWRKALTEEALALLPDDVTCEDCVYAQLPKTRLRKDFEVPCRQSGQFPEAGRCFYGTPAAGPFLIRTPWFWNVGAGEDVNTAEALVEAWEKQKLFEAKSEEGPAVDSESGISEAMLEQRDQIRRFMDYHTHPPFYVGHLWATACEQCKYHRDDSPVKSDPDAPHCEWAKGRHTLSFEALVPSGKGAICPSLRKIMPVGQGLVPLAEWPDFDPAQVEFVIPWCRQFEPKAPWSEIVPESEVPSPFPREVLVDMVEALVKSVNHGVYSVHCRGALQFLTGRPEKVSGHHNRRFPSMFKKQKKKLSDLQLWTLVQWLQLEFVRPSSLSRIVPVGGDRVTMKCSIMDFTTALGMWAEGEEEESEDG
jgi:hypothetical protein